MNRLLWAKSDNERYRHPLIFHMLDVAAVASTMWDRVFSQSFRSMIASEISLSEEGCKTWLSFFVGLHDIGKAIPCFQIKDTAAMEQLKAAGFDFPQHIQSRHHSLATTAILESFLPDFSSDGNILFPKQMSKHIATALGGHHGIFPRSVDNTNDLCEIHNVMGRNAVWTNARKDLFNTLVSVTGVKTAPIPQSTILKPGFIMTLAGFTSVADWIGSMTEYFPFEPSFDRDDAEYYSLSKNRATYALDKLGWTRWRPPSETLPFSTLFGFQPRPLQEKVVLMDAKSQSSGIPPGLVIIEAPMGEGKTEAAMFLADSWGVRLGRNGCYFALPTQASGNQMFQRVRGFLENRYDESVLLLLHGKAAISEEYRKIRFADVHDENSENGKGTVSVEDWFLQRKRGLLAPFAVGTVDQALLATLRMRHNFVRLFGLSQKTVIIDEVHAYDTYMSAILDRLLSWLGEMRVPVILLSATLPALRRRELIMAYSGKSFPDSAISYPRITWTTTRNEITSVEARQFESTPKDDIHLYSIDSSPQSIASELSSRLSAGGCAVMICNLVSRAQDVYTVLKESGFSPERGELFLFHARFPEGQKEKIENHVVSLFGKQASGSGNRPNRAVLVATQVVEQSLDLDFDLMITDPAPIDLVLQRAGRLHRHSIRRPAGLESPLLLLCRPTENTSGVPDFSEIAGVYNEYIMLRSHLALINLSKIQIPFDIEPLIESVYGDIKLPFENDSPWSKLLTEYRVEMEKEKTCADGKARTNMILSPDKAISDILEQFNTDLTDDDDPRVVKAFRAATRLAEPSVSVVCLHETEGDLSLDAEGLVQVDLNTEPNIEATIKLLRSSVRLSNYGIVKELLNDSAPGVWRRNSLLRHCRVIHLNNGEAMIGNYLLRLDDELGIVIEKRS